LAYFLAAGLPLNEAARKAGAVATRSVLEPGTQTSFPGRQEIDRFLRETGDT
jgi:sugar/nucleoside kinase (ribokinase family)